MANNKTGEGEIRRFDAPKFTARVLDNSGSLITQAATTSITYTIYRLRRSDPQYREPITTHTNIACTVASVVFDTLQTGALWGSKDTTGYNFSHQPSVAGSVFDKIGTDQYLVEYTITPTTGQSIRIGFLVSVTV